MIWVAVVVGSLFLAEFYGYWLHVLLHSYIIKSASRSHMNHHVLSYGPDKHQRSAKYIQEIRQGDLLIAGLGPEWIIPSVILVVFTAFVEHLLGLSWTQIIVSEVIILAYSVFLFWWLHDRMHVRGVWLLKLPYFRKIRRRHDIHHVHVTDEGLMNRNYGIAFPFFDHVFGTYKENAGRLNRKGIQAAEDRYNEQIRR
jgi:sterol desaturase/sphingolipid hydroxylase (fatty acid hydroxylase superfamily)